MGREADREHLEKSLNDPNPEVRQSARESLSKISNETRAVKSMRESLIKEHRQGRVENVKDIHEIVKKKSKYQ